MPYEFKSETSVIASPARKAVPSILHTATMDTAVHELSPEYHDVH